MYLQKSQLTSWAFASHSLLSLVQAKEKPLESDGSISAENERIEVSMDLGASSEESVDSEAILEEPTEANNNANNKNKNSVHDVACIDVDSCCYW